MAAPLTRSDFLCRIAAETAKMSYPGSMSRGKRPVVLKGTKALVESYFIRQFPMAEMWEDANRIAKTFEDWHRGQSQAIAGTIKCSVPDYHDPVAVSTKFLNTFLHQLMKYEPCRLLWRSLHLPLDQRVFKALRRLRPESLSFVQQYFSQSPYALRYDTYCSIQQCLAQYVNELNCRPGTEFRLTSRIELNWLWIDDFQHPE